MTTLDDIRPAAEAGDHQEVLRLTAAALAERPGDDAAHEYRSRALLALGRLEEAERHAEDAVRLDPDEIRYRELLAELRARLGAHADAAWEYGRLARNDPGQATWTVAEARERLEAADPAQAVEAARRAVRLEPGNGRAQLALARALTHTGDARGAIQAALAAAELLPGDPAAREGLADARWLADEGADAFAEYRALVTELDGSDRRRVTDKARRLYRQRSGPIGMLVAAWAPLFGLALRSGWVRLR